MNATEDMPLTITFDQVLANFSDPDGRPVSISRVEAGPNGTVSVNAAARTITFLGAANFFGAAAFTVVVSDGVKETAGEVQVSVRAVDDAPVLANPIVYAATAGKPLVVSVEAILAAFNDIDGGAFAFNSIVGVSGGPGSTRPFRAVADRCADCSRRTGRHRDVRISGGFRSKPGDLTVRAPTAQVAATDAEIPEGSSVAGDADVILATAAEQMAETEIVTASISPNSLMKAGFENALVLPDLALPATLPSVAVAAVSQRDHLAMNTALLTGGFSLMAFSKAQSQKMASRRASDEANELLSPFLAGTEEEDLHTSLGTMRTMMVLCL